MLVLIVLVAVVILAGIVVVALGGGGELSRDRPGRPEAADLRSWYDVASYRPPGALLGYDAGATQEALAQAARVVAERDAEIDQLRRRLAAAAADSEPEPAAGSAAE